MYATELNVGCFQFFFAVWEEFNSRIWFSVYSNVITSE
jgi:hypothetical protein